MGLGRSNAPRGSFRSKCQVKALLHDLINKGFLVLACIFFEQKGTSLKKKRQVGS